VFLVQIDLLGLPEPACVREAQLLLLTANKPASDSGHFFVKHF